MRVVACRRTASNDESMNTWPDRDEMLGDWKEALTGNVTNPNGVLEAEADFSKPRVIGQATKRCKTRGPETGLSGPHGQQERTDFAFQPLTLCREDWAVESTSAAASLSRPLSRHHLCPRQRGENETLLGVRLDRGSRKFGRTFCKINCN